MKSKRLNNLKKKKPSNKQLKFILQGSKKKKVQSTPNLVVERKNKD